jgi:hypothetical protein
VPTNAKIQILCAVGFLEVIGELSPVMEANGEKHYVRGGKPGYYPPFKGFFNKEYWPHPLPLNLFDPFGFTAKMTPERKAKALIAELNNGTPAPESSPSHRILTLTLAQARARAPKATALIAELTNGTRPDLTGLDLT